MCSKGKNRRNTTEQEAAKAIKAYLKKKQAEFASKPKVSIGELKLISSEYHK